LSFSVDANVLLYASNSSSEHHATAVEFLESCVAGREVLYLAWPTAMAYLRIATHGRIFDHPLSPDEALANLRSLTARAHVRMVGERADFLDAYAEVTGASPVRGNLVPDAHLAVLLLQNGIRTLYTNDADFRRFPFLDVRNPFVSAT